MKKILSFVLALSLILTSAVPAFAEETDSKGLEKAILQVKNVVNVSTEYKDFQYSSSEYEENGKTVSVWYLNWANEDYSEGISATVENNGYLLSYSTFNGDENEGLGAVTKDAAKKTANDFLKKARPDIFADLKLVENQNYMNTYRHSFNYRLYKNGIAVDFADVSVEVDKYTGKVNFFNYEGTGETFKDLPSKEGVIGIDAAKKAYIEKIGIKLSYYSSFDYDKKILTIFPAYGLSGYGDEAIDAKTGQTIKLYNSNYWNYGGGGEDGMSKIADSATAENALTKEETDAIANVSGLISKEKAESIIRSMVPGITSDMKLDTASLSKNYIEPDKYNWEIGFDGAYGVVNAKTSELVSFYIYDEDSYKGNAKLSEASAKEKAEAYIKKTAPEKFQQSKFYNNANPSVVYDQSEVTEYSFNYYRQVNGIDFVGNSFSVTVNKDSGMITQYDCNWYDVIKFPSIEKVITTGAAFEAVNETGKMDLVYKKVKEGETGLVYDFSNPVGDFLINPFSGAKLGWDGTSYKEASLPQYTDIKGHWAEVTINKLIENGYYIEGEKFNPSQNITQIGFLRYIYSPIQYYYNDEDFYDMLISDKIIKENEKAPTTAITRQDAAKFVVRYLGQGRTAEHPEIFLNPYKDKITQSYKGYAAVCYGLGIMKGDKKGRFNGTAAVTNAEAATIIYNTLQVH